ncbi:MAG: MerR family transcriptional regulator [Psittacicella sp.]
MKVAELAKISNVTPETIRYYTRCGLLNYSVAKNNYKVYSEDSVERMIFIKNSKLIGFTLNDIKHLISISKDKNCLCPEIRELLDIKIDLLKHKIESMEKRLDFLLKTKEDWGLKKNTLLKGESICGLIEGLSQH